MLRGKWILGLAMAAMAAVAVVHRAVSQEGPPPPGGRDGGDVRQRAEQFRQQMEQRMKESLGISEEEWKVLQPKIEKVQTLQRQGRGGMGMMMGRMGPGGPGDRGGAGGPGAPGGDQPNANDRPQSEIEKKAADLQKTLDNQDSKAEDLKVALTAYREARSKAKEELEKAQKELKELLTLKQEARCVMMGLLE